jgi:hypothetical protein
MSPSQSSESSFDDPSLLQAIDRLVDGELSPADESRLLAQLDVTPDGWRQLALAFVESRRWKSALTERVSDLALSARRNSGNFGSGIDARPTAAAAANPSPPRSRRLFAAALVASLLAGAFSGLGIARWRADARAARMAADMEPSRSTSR